MKSPYVSELQPNQMVAGTFLVQSKDIRQKKTGEPYLSLLLCDRTGELDCKMWDNAAEVMDTFERDDYVKVRGMAQIHQNRLQLSIHKLQRVDTAEVDATDYFPASTRDPNEMFAELRGFVAAMANLHLRGLLEAILGDEDVARRYAIAPAAKSIHHAYLGGLIEHVLSMCHLGRAIASHYKSVDPDLLLAGVVLHDIGKIYELTYDRSFGYSTEGHLLGHMQIGLRMMDEKLRAFPEFPPRLRTLLEHLIISHHGCLEFGSPKVPMFPEALLLHHLDNLDSKMEAMRVALDKDRQVDGHLTSYVQSLERSVLKKDKYLNEPAKAAAPADPQSARPEDRRNDSGRQQKPPKPPSVSVFGERLQQALRKD